MVNGAKAEPGVSRGLTSTSTDDASAPVSHSVGSFLTVQALRAIAALLVVIYHAFEMWELRITPGAAGPAWSNGAAGVDIFFVISGFVMVVSSQRLRTQSQAGLIFLHHRVVRIVPLYWLLTTMKLLLVFLFADLALRSNLDVGYVVRSYLFLPLLDNAGHFRPLLPVGWTLSYEFLFYLLFALALALRTDALVVLIPAFVVVAIVALLRSADWPAWTIVFNTIVVEFLFGVLLGKATLSGRRLPAGLAAAAVFAGFALVLTTPAAPENLRVLAWGLPAAMIVSGAVALERQIAPILPRWLLSFGDASYSIYLVHGFALPVVGLAIIALHWETLTAEAVTVAACLIVGSLAGWCAYVAIERPMTAALKRRAAG